jgi:penicillin-binding protein 1A
MRRLPESVHLDGVHPARTERIRPRAKEMNGLNDWLAKRKRRGRFWSRLGVFDSWLDSSIAGGWEAVQDRYNAASSFFARFRLSGWKRIANEVASEALTLGCGGLLLLYMLALPAFQEID